MIHVLTMAQFMHLHTVQNLLRHEYQKTVEIQIPVLSTASPSGRLKPDCNPAVSYADFLCPVRNSLRDTLFRLSFNFADFHITQHSKRSSFFLFPILLFQILCNPVFFRKKKLLYRAFTGSIRSFYENTVVRHYTDRN